MSWCCRAEGGCSEPYLSADLALVRCYTCNRMGHLCCKEGPQEPPEPSCHNCGDAGHMAVDCRMDKPQKASLSVLSCMQSQAQPSSSALLLYPSFFCPVFSFLSDEKILHGDPISTLGCCAKSDLGHVHAHAAVRAYVPQQHVEALGVGSWHVQ